MPSSFGLSCRDGVNIFVLDPVQRSKEEWEDSVNCKSSFKKPEQASTSVKKMKKWQILGEELNQLREKKLTCLRAISAE